MHAKKIDHTISLDDLIEFSLENLSSKHDGISITAATIIRQLTQGLIKFDEELLIKRNSAEYTGEKTDEDDEENHNWHILEKFRITMENYQDVIKEFLIDFRYNIINYDKIKH